ncbi:hypothetical protein AAFF_G00254970 [Aldrovandia affinis]|uniref:Uncharacterized protein n=1 Tax=Aldrovandia affinis TaxID=143900 RepID=A0AAD7RCC8_9TELE|nr:hypothetical protein AAFF_G00254970 [Aldrovandia affinis]
MNNVRGFTAAFLFSLETQTTIGYGFRGMTENCALAIAVVTLQDVISCFIDTGGDRAWPWPRWPRRRRAQTVGFSGSAVVSRRDGVLCLSWRLGDFRRNHVVEGVARAQVVRLDVTPAGELGVSSTDLALQQSDVILATPATLTHRIVPGARYPLGPALQGRAACERSCYKVDFSLFHQTVSVPLPELSAREQDRCSKQNPAPPSPTARPTTAQTPPPRT